MRYRKFSAAHIFTGRQLLGSDQVLIVNDDAIIEDIVHATDAGDDVQQFAGVLAPGFVNCHCHLELSHMRGLIPESTGLVDFVFKVVTERHHSDEIIAEAIRQAETEMIRNGIVATGDICNNASTINTKKNGKLHYYNFIEVSGWLPEVAKGRMERAMEFYRLFSEVKIQSRPGGTKFKTVLAPHAPYSVSEPLWELMQPYFPGKTVTIHNQETAYEDELFSLGTGDFTRMYGMMKLDTSFFKPTGQTSLQSYFDKLQAAAQVILVHNTFTKQADIEFVKHKEASVNWCICIKANQYIEKAIPPIELLRKNGCRIVIGTDSLASNNSLDMLDELKTIRNFFPHILLGDLLQWATLNGAQALQMEDAIGSFEKGKKPGVLHITHLENNNLSSNSSAQRIC